MTFVWRNFVNTCRNYKIDVMLTLLDHAFEKYRIFCPILCSFDVILMGVRDNILQIRRKK